MLDKDRLGAAIWNRVKAESSFSPPIGAPQDAQGLALWTAIAEEIINEFTVNGQVAPGTFKDSLAAPVTGLGVIQ